jgi:hypothetical protein
MNKKLTDEQIKEIVELYHSKPAERLKLPERYNVLPTLIYKAMKLAKVKFRPIENLTLTEKQQIVDWYQAHRFKSIELTILFTVHPSIITDVLAESNIKPRTASERHRQYKCNYNFFSDLNPTSAYWAGFIAGDGNIHIPQSKEDKNKENYSPVIKIGLAAEDKTHLDKFREALESNHIIRIVNQSHRNRQPLADITIASQELADDLTKNFCIRPNKSLNMQWPLHLPIDLQRHFLRGLFDADGCWWVGKPIGNQHPPLEWSLIGSISAIEKIQDLLFEHLGLPRGKFNKKKAGSKHSTHENIVAIRYKGRGHVIKIFNFIYQDAGVWLERKRDKIEPFLKQDEPVQMRLTKEQQLEVCRLYQEEKLSSAIIAKQFKMTSSPILKILEKHNVPCRTNSEAQKLAKQQRLLCKPIQLSLNFDED